MKKYHFKHEYAFNQFGQIVHIDDAIKNNRGEKYYKDKNLNIEFILVDGNIKAKHFREPSNYIINHNGISINSNQINESPEHYNFKMKIIKDGFFYYDNYKIFIKEPKDEYVLVGSKYRIDLYAKLLCDTPISIEIIKTSDISFNKTNYIKELELLTFKIYINEDGNQEPKQFDIIGNKQLEQLKDEYIKATREHSNIVTKNGIEARNIEKRFEAENDNLQKQYREYIEEQDRKIDSFKSDTKSEYYNIENEIRDIREKILYTLRKIKRVRVDASKEIEHLQREIELLNQNIKENKYHKSIIK